MDATTLSQKYWAGDVLYSNKCGLDRNGREYPFCYDTQVEYVLAEPDGWKEYYERIFLLRSRELDAIIERPPSFMHKSAKVFLFGQSEGGMVAARYFHKELEARLLGRIIAAWSCEYNYFVGSSAGSKICDGRCKSSTPILNIIGTEDNYFSARNFSVASRVAKSENGYGQQDLKGHCLAAIQSGGFRSAAVALLDGGGHDSSLTHDVMTRNLLKDFLASPSETVSGRSRTMRTECRRIERYLYECKKDQMQPKGSPWQVDDSAFLVPKRGNFTFSFDFHKEHETSDDLFAPVRTGAISCAFMLLIWMVLQRKHWFKRLMNGKAHHKRHFQRL
eukprot:TRINITY_DN6677_c1_g2_i4.p1 TRINITY_DN6677_c1_g2~~TRINITY_DN6677_c1_g2_i4.p1  ORF type:complete len:333 (+),score=49.58 TRINITY_DN6677_c1_g2_i4:676-1674(+)